jgi:hypothetical protein
MWAEAHLIVSFRGVLAVERWASDWLGRAWFAVGTGQRRPEPTLCEEVVRRATAHPSRYALAVLAALRRVAPADETGQLDEAIEAVQTGVGEPAWLGAAPFTPVRAWQALDPWDSERVLFVEYTSDNPDADTHTLMAEIAEPGGTFVRGLAITYADTPQRWDELHADDEVPLPIEEANIADVLTDLASALRRTDMMWPRNDNPHFIATRALAWSRCEEFLPDWPDKADEDSDTLADAFMAEVECESDVEAVRSVARIVAQYSYGYLGRGPLTWSPDWVELFLVDYLPSRELLNAAERRVLPDTIRRWVHFVLTRRGVDDRWIEPVVAAVEEHLPAFEAAMEDESGPAKQIAAELAARSVDPQDKALVNQVISELSAQRLARQLLENR